jgi:hypothetical protein
MSFVIKEKPMAMIASRSPQTNPTFAPRAYQNVSIDPMAYDSGGTALAGLGNAFGTVADQADRIYTRQKQEEQAALQAQAEREKRDEIIDALNRVEKNTRETVAALHPDDPSSAGNAPQGYLAKTGKDAVVSHDAINQKLTKDHQAIRQTISSEEGRARFDAAAESMNGPIKDILNDHLAKQRIVASKETADIAMDEARKTFTTFKDNEKIANIAWETGKAEAARSAALNPDPNVTPAKEIAKWESGTHRSVIQSDLARGNLDQAEAYLNTFKNQLQGEDLEVVTAEVGRKRDHATADTALAPLREKLNTAKKAPPAAKKTDTPTTDQGASAVKVRPVAAAALSPYPYRRGANEGLPSLESLQQDFEKTADHSELTETQRDYGWASLRRDYVMAKKAALQQRQNDLTTSMQMITEGATLSELPLDLQSRLDPENRQGLERFFQRVHGFADDETDWAALDAIASDSDADFSQRLLVQDQPYLSSGFHKALGYVQGLVRSNDLQQRNQGLRYLRGIRLSAEAIRLLPSGLRTSARMEMMVGDTFKMVDSAIQNGETLSAAQIKKGLAPYLHETRLEQVRGK